MQDKIIPVQEFSRIKARFFARIGFFKDISRYLHPYILHVSCTLSLCQPTSGLSPERDRAHAEWTRRRAAHLSPTNPRQQGYLGDKVRLLAYHWGCTTCPYSTNAVEGIARPRAMPLNSEASSGREASRGGESV